MTTPAVTIHSKKPGFRRAGIEHPAIATYPAGHWTEDELAALMAEPMLIVSEAGDPEPGPPSGDDIRAAIAGLDPDKDFTQAGEPKIEPLERLLGAKVTRAQVNAATAG